MKVDLFDDAAVTVVLASGGYPGPYETGQPIDGLAAAAALDDVTVFHAGTAERDGRVVTAGGRVLAVTGLGAGGRRCATPRVRGRAIRISFDGMRTGAATSPTPDRRRRHRGERRSAERRGAGRLARPSCRSCARRA